MKDLQIVYLDPHSLKPYERNTRKHGPKDIDQIKASIEADGFNDPIGIWGEQNIIVEGHGRQIAAIEMGLDKVPCIRLDHLTDTQRRDYALRHNRTAELSIWDIEQLKEEIAQLELDGIDLSGLEFDFIEDDVGISTDHNSGGMKEKYLVPPFSVIYANKPDWLARKRQWVTRGLHSEIGRGGGLAFNSRSDPEANFGQNRGGVQASRDEQSVQKQYPVKQLHDKSKAYSDGLIAKREEIRKKGNGRII